MVPSELSRHEPSSTEGSDTASRGWNRPISASTTRSSWTRGGRLAIPLSDDKSPPVRPQASPGGSLKTPRVRVLGVAACVASLAAEESRGGGGAQAESTTVAAI